MPGVQGAGLFLVALLLASPVAAEDTAPSSWSGAIYAGVPAPRKDSVDETKSTPVSARPRARPKSVTMARKLPSLARTSMILPGFRSP